MDKRRYFKIEHKRRGRGSCLISFRTITRLSLRDYVAEALAGKCWTAQ